MFTLTVTNEDDKRILGLAGRIDSTNAADAEKELTDALEGFTGAPVLDAQDLEYISSAGLRVVLRLKKAYDGIKVVNCSPEIYDIFEMTGFTEMMEIARAYRRLSVEGCEVIGEGDPSASAFSVRSLIEHACAAGSNVVILAHNHPQGSAAPSDTDIAVTRQLAETLAKSGISLADHVIVGSGETVSLRSLGVFMGLD